MKMPEYYMTPAEFAEVVINSMEELEYFKRNQKAHPEDIALTFVTQAHAVAKGADYVISRIPRENRTK